MVGYLFGAADYKDFTWAEYVAYDERDAPYVNTPDNDVEPMKSTANDLVYFCSRALQGKYFDDPGKLHEFRRILSIGDAISLLPVPLGVSAFAKGGSADVPGYHAICIPGAMRFDDQWVYFAFALNWHNDAPVDRRRSAPSPPPAARRCAR